MPTRPEVATFDVDCSVFVHIDGRPGTELTCLEGRLWVTHDGCVADVVLATGQRHVVTHSSRLIVSGFGPGCLRVAQQPAAPARSALWNVLRRSVAPPCPAVAKPVALTA